MELRDAEQVKRPEMKSHLEEMLKEMASRCIGQDEALKLCLGAYLTGGHVLVEDIPGVGKTTLAKTLAGAVEAGFSRVQFTPDLMPSDVLGVSVYDLNSGAFSFKKGPIFTQIFMADEINRASPKTQSSLLEAMEERQVTMDGRTYPLGSPFMVIATQNPIEFEGTFPLPEAQMDRFMIKLALGYPKPEDERAIYKKETIGRTAPPPYHLSLGDYQYLNETISKVVVSESIYDYVQRLSERSRKHEYVYYGLSPRGGIAMIKMAKYWAYMAGRAYCIPEDVKAVAPAVMRHRLLMKPEALYSQHTAEETIAQLLQLTAVPKGSFDHGL